MVLSIFDFIGKFRKKNKDLRYAQMLSNYLPITTSFGNDIYASDAVNQAVECITKEMMKLDPHHIRRNDDEYSIVADSVEFILQNPNETMTKADLIEKTVWMYYIDYNAYIIPTYEVYGFDKNGNELRRYTGLYPVRPASVEMMQDQAGKLGIHFTFVNGYECTLAYDDVIHLKNRFSVNEYFGGDDQGRPDHKALLKTLDLNETLLESVSKALKSSLSINGIIKYNSYLDDDKEKKAISDFEKRIKENESGFLALDNKAEFQKINFDPKIIDASTLEFIDKKILRNFGVPIEILNGSYTKEQYDAFYQKTLEPLITLMSQEFTKKMFSPRERAFENAVEFFPAKLIFMTNSEKISLFNMLIDTASCYKNELRYAFGLSPMNDFSGQLAISSQKHFAENSSDKENMKGGT